VADVLRVWNGVVSRSDCRALVESMAGAVAMAGGVLRQSQDAVDPRLRRCTEHAVGAEQAAVIVDAMREIAGQVADGSVALDGPKFCGYGAGEYFRAHRDRSADPLDPPVVRARRFTLVCLLNDDDPADGLPVFDGGALVVHVPRDDGRVEPRNVQLRAGSIALFAADLLHEVRPVRSGTRHTAIGWLFSPDEIREQA
jgi:predicted 2-oxoglutarate/Fe(II)-dependent dioxygenase YbiX